VFLVVTACSAQPLTTTEPSLRISHISIDRREIADQKDSSDQDAVGWLANKLHVLTREQIVRNELLLRESEPFHPGLAEESIRNLRRMGIFDEVHLRVDTVNREATTVLVETRDQLTMNVNVSYKNDGGVKNFSTGFSEDNFLGRAQHVSVSYDYNSLRTDPHGAELRFVERRAFATRWGITVQHKNSEDLLISTVLAERPFFEERASWSAGLYADDGRIRRRTYYNNIQIGQQDILQQNQNVWLVYSAGKKTKARTGISLLRTRTESSAGPLRRFDNLDLLNVSLGMVHRTWRQEKFLNNIERVEDVPYGIACDFIGGKNFRAFDIGNTGYYFQAGGVVAAEVSEGWYLSSLVAYAGYTVISNPSETTLSWSVLTHTKIFPRHLLVARVGGVIGSAWSPGRQITLGSPSGLRGYGANFVSGNRMLLLNVEDRLRLKVDWWILRFGAAMFADCGTAWNEGSDLARQRFYSSVGFGLRIEKSKQLGSGVIRIDAAFNTHRGGFSELILTSSHFLNGFNEIETTLPNAGR
jgi:outer membrane protein assembly factor BamA